MSALKLSGWELENNKWPFLEWSANSRASLSSSYLPTQDLRASTRPRATHAKLAQMLYRRSDAFETLRVLCNVWTTSSSSLTSSILVAAIEWRKITMNGVNEEYN